MGFMSKLWGGSGERSDQVAASDAIDCPHGTLIPRWASAEDMGKVDRVTNYTCESCEKSLSPEEAALVQADEPGLLAPRV